MNNRADIQNFLQDLFRTQRSAVLATQEAGQPYLSLMAFAVAPDLKHLVVATDRDTRKFRNLQTNKGVALLVDNRTNQPADTKEAVAVTILGEAEEVDPAEKEATLRLFLDKHPHLEGFATSPNCAVVKVKIRSYLVVRKFQEVLELKPA